MPKNIDSLQELLRSDPLPQAYYISTPEQQQQFNKDLVNWLERFLNKLTSKNIDDGIDSIS